MIGHRTASGAKVKRGRRGPVLMPMVPTHSRPAEPVRGPNTAPTTIPLEIEDLRSRLNWDQAYQLKPANDETKLEILKQKASERSFDLGDDVIEYLMRRVDRDLSSLLKILDKIDHASLAAKRKITIPFVKELIS